MSDIFENKVDDQPKAKVASNEPKVYPYEESEIVTIHRVGKKPVLPEEGVLGETARDYKLCIGSSFKGNSGRLLGRAIFTVEEEKELMSRVIGLEPSHMDWNKTLEDY